MHLTIFCLCSDRSSSDALRCLFGDGAYFGGQLTLPLVQSTSWLNVAVGACCGSCFCVIDLTRYRLHNVCQEEVEFRSIMKATHHDAAFDAALLETLQEHDPADLIWTRNSDTQQPFNTIFNPRLDPLLFIRGNITAGYRGDVVGGKRKLFTESMEERGIKRPQHSREAARVRRMGNR
jgi:hypothetical protein